MRLRSTTFAGGSSCTRAPNHAALSRGSRILTVTMSRACGCSNALPSRMDSRLLWLLLRTVSLEDLGPIYPNTHTVITIHDRSAAKLTLPLPYQTYAVQWVWKGLCLVSLHGGSQEPIVWSSWLENRNLRLSVTLETCIVIEDRSCVHRSTQMRPKWCKQRWIIVLYPFGTFGLVLSSETPVSS